MSHFRRKSIAPTEEGNENGLKRTLGAGDLILLGVGAIVGAGIFGSVSQAAGKAGPAVILSFLLLGGACALAALCYAELASMIPQAGSAYTYAYATMGRLVAWIIGWDLILEYAVGNVAVAISWSDYVTGLLDGCGWRIPIWLHTGYREALLSQDPAIHGLLESCPKFLGIPLLLNVPAAGIVALITWLLLLGARESSRVNHWLVAVKLLVLVVFIVVGSRYLHVENYQPFAPHGWHGIHQGAAIVFFAYIGFDAISTAAEETINPQRNLPIGILGALAICTAIYALVSFVLVGMMPTDQLAQSSDPLAKAMEFAGAPVTQWVIGLGAAVAMAAVLFVFQFGQSRIFYAMARDGLLPAWVGKVNPKTRVPQGTTLFTGLAVAAWALIGDAGETYELTNIGTLFAFLLVCVGVLILRVVDADRPRGFRVPGVWVVAILGAGSCFYIMLGLPVATWVRFGVWLGIGLAYYFLRCAKSGGRAK